MRAKYCQVHSLPNKVTFHTAEVVRHACDMRRIIAGTRRCFTLSSESFDEAYEDPCRLRKNATKRGKSFLQGLKPVESTQFTSALKHRPPEEKDFFRSLLELYLRIEASAS